MVWCGLVRQVRSGEVRSDAVRCCVVGSGKAGKVRYGPVR